MDSCVESILELSEDDDNDEQQEKENAKKLGRSSSSIFQNSMDKIANFNNNVSKSILRPVNNNSYSSLSNVTNLSNNTTIRKTDLQSMKSIIIEEDENNDSDTDFNDWIQNSTTSLVKNKVEEKSMLNLINKKSSKTLISTNMNESNLNNVNKCEANQSLLITKTENKEKNDEKSLLVLDSELAKNANWLIADNSLLTAAAVRYSSLLKYR
jgi:hypothetical protein